MYSRAELLKRFQTRTFRRNRSSAIVYWDGKTGRPLRAVPPHMFPQSSSSLIFLCPSVTQQVFCVAGCWSVGRVCATERGVNANLSHRRCPEQHKAAFCPQRRITAADLSDSFLLLFIAQNEKHSAVSSFGCSRRKVDVLFSDSSSSEAGQWGQTTTAAVTFCCCRSLNTTSRFAVC